MIDREPMVVAVHDEHRMPELLYRLLKRDQKRLERLAIFRFFVERIPVQRDHNGGSAGSLRRAEGFANPIAAASVLRLAAVSSTAVRAGKGLMPFALPIR